MLNELDLEKELQVKKMCLLYQLGVLIGNDIYSDLENLYPQNVQRRANKFSKRKPEFISY